jgi:hypothetical protein
MAAMPMTAIQSPMIAIPISFMMAISMLIPRKATTMKAISKIAMPKADSDKADGSEKSDEDTPAFGKFTTDLDEILGIRRQTVLEDREEGEKPDVVYQVGIVTKETWAAKGGQWLVWNEDAEDRLRNTAAGKSRTLMPEPDLGSGVLG